MMLNITRLTQYIMGLIKVIYHHSHKNAHDEWNQHVTITQSILDWVSKDPYHRTSVANLTLPAGSLIQYDTKQNRLSLWSLHSDTTRYTPTVYHSHSRDSKGSTALIALAHRSVHDATTYTCIGRSTSHDGNDILARKLETWFERKHTFNDMRQRHHSAPAPQNVLQELLSLYDDADTFFKGPGVLGLHLFDNKKPPFSPRIDIVYGGQSNAFTEMYDFMNDLIDVYWSWVENDPSLDHSYKNKVALARTFSPTNIETARMLASINHNNLQTSDNCALLTLPSDLEIIKMPC